MIKIYTDGSAAKNRSGWGYVTVYPDKSTNLCSGVVPNATNQQMELTAVVEALREWLEWTPDENVTVYTDSAYIANCYNERWYINWENNGWLNSKGEPVANKLLWMELIKFFRMPQVSIEKVKGHSGHTYNDIADRLACGNYEPNHLTNTEINDTINIKLSEILIEYKMDKLTVNNTIKKIIEVFNG